jgi:hypothetical protein
LFILGNKPKVFVPDEHPQISHADAFKDAIPNRIAKMYFIKNNLLVEEYQYE